MHNSSQSDHIRRWSKNRRSFSRKVHVSVALWWLVSCAMKIPTLSFCYDPLKLTVRVRVHTKLVINWVGRGFQIWRHFTDHVTFLPQKTILMSASHPEMLSDSDFKSLANIKLYKWNATQILKGHLINYCWFVCVLIGRTASGRGGALKQTNKQVNPLMVKLQVATGYRDTHWARGKDAHSLNFDFSWDADGVNTLQLHSVFVLQQVGAVHSHLNTHGKQHIAGHQFDSHWTVKLKFCRADSSLTPDWSARLSPWTGLGGWGWWARSRPRAWRASRSGSVRGPSTLSSACCTRWTTFWSSGWNGTLRRPAASRCCRRWSPPGTCETANRERRFRFKNLHPDSDVCFFKISDWWWRSASSPVSTRQHRALDQNHLTWQEPTQDRPSKGNRLWTEHHKHEEGQMTTENT